jgi:hypothetical protein
VNPWKNTHSSQGISLLEVLLSVGILGISSLFVLQGMSQVNEYQGMFESASNMQQIDEIARKKLGRALQESMRAEIDGRSEVVGRVTVDGQEIRYASGSDAAECANFSVSVATNVFDYSYLSEDEQQGNRNRFATNSSSLTNDSLEKLYNDMKQNHGLSDHPTTAAALERCREAKTGWSKDLRNQASFFGCMLTSENAVVEYRAALWDFHADKPLNCTQLRGNLGRGIQVAYQIHLIAKNPARAKYGSKMYSVATTGGKFRLPKIVFMRGLENAGQ